MKYLVILASVLALFTSNCDIWDDEQKHVYSFPGGIMYPIWRPGTDLGGIYTPSWSPDSSSILFVRNNNELGITSPDGTDSKSLVTLPGTIHNPRWHPDAARNEIVFINRLPISDYNMNTIYRMDVDEGHPNPVFETTEDIDFASFTFDGNQIVYMRLDDEGGLWRVPASGRVFQQSIENSSGWGTVLSLECSPVDSTVAFFQAKDDEVNIYSISFGGGEPTRLTDFTFGGNQQILNNRSQSARTYYLSWFKDGSRLVFTHLPCSDCNTYNSLDLFLLPAAGGEPTQIPSVTDRRTRPMTPSMSPDGKKMVVEDGGLWLIELDGE
ncbi:hypothetical protein ACFLT7_07075 [candidate division KSB1 bacterium]